MSSAGLAKGAILFLEKTIPYQPAAQARVPAESLACAAGWLDTVEAAFGLPSNMVGLTMIERETSSNSKIPDRTNTVSIE